MGIVGLTRIAIAVRSLDAIMQGLGFSAHGSGLRTCQEAISHSGKSSVASFKGSSTNIDRQIDRQQ